MQKFINLIYKNYVFFIFISVSLFIFITYSSSLFYPFVQDDWCFIYFVKFKTLLEGIIEILTPNHLFYRPLSKLYSLVIYEFFKLNSMPAHIIALFIHSLNSFLIFIVTKKIFKTSNLIPICAAFLFAGSIGIIIDLIIWVLEISDFAAMFFALLTIYLYIDKRKNPAAISFLIGLLFKETIFFLPYFLLHMEYFLFEETLLKIYSKITLYLFL